MQNLVGGASFLCLRNKRPLWLGRASRGQFVGLDPKPLHPLFWGSSLLPIEDSVFGKADQGTYLPRSEAKWVLGALLPGPPLGPGPPQITLQGWVCDPGSANRVLTVLHDINLNRTLEAHADRCGAHGLVRRGYPAVQHLPPPLGSLQYIPMALS